MELDSPTLHYTQTKLPACKKKKKSAFLVLSFFLFTQSRILIGVGGSSPTPIHLHLFRFLLFFPSTILEMPSKKKLYLKWVLLPCFSLSFISLLCNSLIQFLNLHYNCLELVANFKFLHPSLSSTLQEGNIHALCQSIIFILYKKKIIIISLFTHRSL